MNAKELDRLLQDWGKFWASREALQGYASTSVTERCCEVMRTGIWASSDKHLFSHQADQVFVPSWVRDIDKCVQQLTEQDHRMIINRRYVKMVKLKRSERVLLWIAQAELLGFL
ncbi:hypothetical protein JAO78_005240 [Alishewanella sp. 16-MA]|uniref:Uncharacterized protein n=1 Tax=Alishewanella maricola TaxID=2795740 RepID=A0ABS8C1L1_9ALTE|nr:hypothetical protein [Alishewanella maricola]MCB5226216.1 hypothetical protein [Alishewanella maricola]